MCFIDFFSSAGLESNLHKGPILCLNVGIVEIKLHIHPGVDENLKEKKLLIPRKIKIVNQYSGNEGPNSVEKQPGYLVFPAGERPMKKGALFHPLQRQVFQASTIEREKAGIRGLAANYARCQPLYTHSIQAIRAAPVFLNR